METASGEITDPWNLTSMELMLRDHYAHLLGAECGLDFALPMSLSVLLLRESVVSSGGLDYKEEYPCFICLRWVTDNWVLWVKRPGFF